MGCRGPQGAFLLAALFAAQASVASRSVGEREFQARVAEIYVGSIETSRRLEEHSVHRDMWPSASDDSLEEIATTSLMDVRSRCSADFLESIPPHDINVFAVTCLMGNSGYRLGVDQAGRLFRFGGFEKSDFAAASGPLDLSRAAEVIRRAADYERLHEIGCRPIVTRQDASAAEEAVLRVDRTRQFIATLPTMKMAGASGIVTVQVFWPGSGRVLERRLRLDAAGDVSIEAERVLVDLYGAKY
jgi:hypothetical protein